MCKESLYLFQLGFVGLSCLVKFILMEIHSAIQVEQKIAINLIWWIEER